MAIRWDKFTVKAQEAVQRANELASEHGMCNQGGEASCENDCYLNALGKAVIKCNDPNLGAALSKCGFNLAE